jgi:molybdate-binding protein
VDRRRDATRHTCLVAGYSQLVAELARAVAAGDYAPGGVFISVRDTARRYQASDATALRAFRELAAAGVIVTAPRRAARVAPDAALAAARLLDGQPPLRIAGEDDPAVSRVVPDGVVRVGPATSFAGLGAIVDGTADACVIALWHQSGVFNEPYATVTDPPARYVAMWQRPVGLLVAARQQGRVRGVRDLAGLRVARRPVGSGTRALLDRMVLDAGIELDANDPEVERHLDVALAVASGAADAGLSVAAVAAIVDVAFVPLTMEPVGLLVTEDRLPRVEPLLRRLRTAETQSLLASIDGYQQAPTPAGSPVVSGTPPASRRGGSRQPRH